MRPEGGWTDELLDEMRHTADEPADKVAEYIATNLSIKDVNKQLMALEKNKDIPDGFDEIIGEFLETTGRLPDWADPFKIDKAEQLFFDHGLMSIVGLFCAALPRCYVMADEALVLQAAGQLEHHTELRMRETAQMIFWVMDSGGLGPEGYGIHKIQKVRLIHAMIRYHLLGSDSDQELLQAFQKVSSKPKRKWDKPTQGEPISQEQLAYTLLTFHYVFIRAWRTLGVPMTPVDEEAYLHCWNVAGHVLGLHRDLMPETMAEAAELFRRLRERDVSRRTRQSKAAGRQLASALVGLMEKTIPVKLLKPFGALLPRKLIGKEDADYLAIDSEVSMVTRILFGGTMAGLQGMDAVLDLFKSRYSVLRPIGRFVSQVFVKNLLLDQTRPLDLPDHLLQGWSRDLHPHGFLNRLEGWGRGESLREVKRPSS